MIQALKNLIDRTTMYQLVLWYLAVLLVAGVAASAFGLLLAAPFDILWSAIVLLTAAWALNELLARFFGAVTNDESAIITALILALIMPPVAFSDAMGTLGLVLVAFLAVGSKFVLSYRSKHVFNPAAFAAVVAGLTLGIPAIWWVGGNLVLLPFVLVGGLLVVYKLHRFDLVLAFFAVALVAAALTSGNPLAAVQATILHSALFFLAFAMLTEPLTMPPTRGKRLVYGAIVGALFTPAAHIGSFYLSPELALVVGNLFAFATSPKVRHALTLLGRREVAQGTHEFVFSTDRPLRFSPGQYLEWTLAGVPFDWRGNRRYFTIASAPEEETVALAMRIPELPSAFKRTLHALPEGGTIHVGSLAGDFTLPRDLGRKLAFIAGGIGVTPFASMVRHAFKTGEKRDAVLLYANRSAADIAYRDLFDAAASLGWRTVYALGEDAPIPGARKGHVDADFIKAEVPDYRGRTFYVSGPPGMVGAVKRALRDLGVSRRNIKTDYFPGLG